jgi:protein gp37
MSAKSTIEWTDATWNPVRGCTKVSPGCKHCYAETFAERFRGVMGHPYEQGFDLKLVPHKLAEPLKWPTPKTIFVNSMSDLFQVGVPDAYIEQVVRVMQMANWHTYQVLTKRADRMRDMLAGPLSFAAHDEHIWWGVSVEDKKYGLPRLEALRNTPAGKRFLSVEPLLEDLGQIDLGGIDWVIVGGESGNGARPMEKDWVLNSLRQCQAAEVKFFFKQWGGVRKKKAGRLLNGRTYDDMPPRTSIPVLPLRERKTLMRVVAGWSSNADQRIVSQPPTWVDSIDPCKVIYPTHQCRGPFVGRS